MKICSDCGNKHGSPYTGATAARYASCVLCSEIKPTREHQSYSVTDDKLLRLIIERATGRSDEKLVDSALKIGVLEAEVARLRRVLDEIFFTPVAVREGTAEYEDVQEIRDLAAAALAESLVEGEPTKVVEL